MKIKIQVESDGTVYVAAVDEAAGAPEHRKAATLRAGQEIELDVADVVSSDQIGFGDVVDSQSGETVQATPGGAEGETPTDKPGGGNEGSPQNSEPPAPEAGGEGAPTSAEGEAGGAPAAGEGEQGGGAQSGEPASTSAASEKPLYLVDDSKVGEIHTLGFEESGLETPDGKTLFHFGSDTAGQSATGNADGVSVYADADENDKPVVTASGGEPANGQEGKAGAAEEAKGADA